MARPSGPASILTVLALGAGAAAAAAFTGGVAGPLGVWCLAPLAAAAAFGRGERLPLGAATSLAAVGVAALGGLTIDGPELGVALTTVLSVFALAAMIVGLAVGLVVLQRNAGEEDHRQRQALARLRKALDEQPHLLMAIDLDGRVAATWGAPPPSLPTDFNFHRRLPELASDDTRTRLVEALAKVVAEDRAEVYFAPPGAAHACLALTLRRTAGGVMGMLRDETEAHQARLELENAKAEAEAQNAGKSRFLANMSHELRTPLNAIMGFSDIMRQRLFGPLSDRYAEYAELVHESGRHLLDLINDVLDMSKIEAERYELARDAFDARDAITSVLRLMRGQADRAEVQLRGVLPKDAIDVIADRRAVKQIALNLVSNALKFTPRGGSVTVMLHARPDALELVVSDTGVGIGAEDLQRLGRPYEQAGEAAQKAAGAGLGLSLVRAFSELHGGEMVIESRLGEGTTVTVRLPVLDLPRVAKVP